MTIPEQRQKTLDTISTKTKTLNARADATTQMLQKFEDQLRESEVDIRVYIDIGPFGDESRRTWFGFDRLDNVTSLNHRKLGLAMKTGRTQEGSYNSVSILNTSRSLRIRAANNIDKLLDAINSKLDSVLAITEE